MIEIFYRPNLDTYSYEFYTVKNKRLPALSIHIDESGVIYQIRAEDGQIVENFFNRRDREYSLTYNVSGSDFRNHFVTYSFKEFFLSCYFDDEGRKSDWSLVFQITDYDDNPDARLLKYSLNDYQVFFDGKEVLLRKMIVEVLSQIRKNIS